MNSTWQMRKIMCQAGRQAGYLFDALLAQVVLFPTTTYAHTFCSLLPWNILDYDFFAVSWPVPAYIAIAYFADIAYELSFHDI